MGFISKAWKSVKKVFKKAAPTVGAVAGSFTPLGPIAGSAIGAYLGSVVAGNNTRQHLFSAGAAAVGGAMGGGSAAGGAGSQAGKEAVTQQVAAEAGKQAASQTLTQTGTQTASQVTAQEATKATFAEGAKQFASKYGANIAAGAGAASGVASGTKVKTPSIDNTEEIELLQREKEYEKRKRSSLFETKGGAAGERVGYTGSENRGSIFGN